MKSLVKPQRLSQGDTVAIVSLSWGGAALYPQRYHAGMRELEEKFSVTAVPYPSTTLLPDELYKNPELRARDLHNAFLDPSVAAIICAIGGNDTIRLLPYIDYDVIRKHPKVFLGYSDSTINHLMCFRAGLVSFYGPSIMSGFAENGGMSEYSRTSVAQTLFSDTTPGAISPSKRWTNEYLSWDNPDNQHRRRRTSPTRWRYLQGVEAVQGPLIGGCMQSLETIKGTDLFPQLSEFDTAILFLETSSNMTLTSLRSWLRNYGTSGILDRINGMMFGRPEHVTSESDLKDYENVIMQTLKEYNRGDMPVITRMDFGHTDPMFVIPYGIAAQIDPQNQNFTIMENAVV